MERRLVAILAADVVGYSRLIEQDERETLERFRAHRRDLFEPEVGRHRGRIFKLTGDGFLAEFASVVDALALNPNSADAWRISGVLHANLGDSELAIEHLQQSARLSPLDPLAFATWYGFAVAHFMAERYDEASTWCDRTLREATGFPPALRMKVALSGLLGQAEEGRKWVQRLLAVNPDASVSSLRRFYEIMFKKPACLDAYADGLRKAGLPE